ncbi:hypothetical protein H3H12_00710 [Serratia marcescens]|uniref:Uncharacterized protein n=2 Tax=Serratia marcescens TaxID=615 RepID=A0ABD5BQK1_SERMA|nr:hypothetical protein [Serratia marcescens]MBN3900773.1 hypothetical protein [Serratia marcescens]MBN3911653.1 hypothetical protein [Serratia marcescens]MBN3917448.1 hypothetical protein [Serratia marcescens]MBN3933465.1 hypothetical protein [Serratia marcescens]MBN3952997.1 hypothetical protein [Serratia marcescens]
MTINKAQWAAVEASLKAGARIHFAHQGNTIYVNRALVTETKLVYVVYINNEMPRYWLSEGDEGYEPLVTVYCRKVTYNPHQRAINKIKKMRGGKSYLKRKENAYMHETIVRYEAFFPSARSAVCHFKKIEGLTITAPDEDGGREL